MRILSNVAGHVQQDSWALAGGLQWLVAGGRQWLVTCTLTACAPEPADRELKWEHEAIDKKNNSHLLSIIRSEHLPGLTNDEDCP